MREKLQKAIYELQIVNKDNKLTNVINLLEDLRDYYVLTLKENLIDLVCYRTKEYQLNPKLDMEELIMELNLNNKFAYIKGSIDIENLEIVKKNMFLELIKFLESL